MSKPYETRVLSIIILPEGEAIFSEQATTEQEYNQRIATGELKEA